MSFSVLAASVLVVLLVAALLSYGSRR
jgi:hypothetical protein